MSNKLGVPGTTFVGSATIKHHFNVDPRPKLSIDPFYLLWGLVFATLFVPPLVPSSSIRIDTLAVFFLLPFWILLRGKIVYDTKCRPVIRAMMALFLGVSIPLLLQFIFLVESFDSRYLINLQGYLRPLFFALFAAVLISSYKNALTLAQLILIGIIIHQIFVIIDYFHLLPFSSVVNLLYRGDIERGAGFRALGAFETIHSLAYFSVYSFLFCLCIVSQTQKRLRINRLAQWAMYSSLIGVLFSFSIGAWLTFFASICFFFIRSGQVKNITKLIKLILGSFVLITLMVIIKAEILEKFFYYYNSFLLGVQYLIGISSEKVQFVSGRLDHGWKHAIEGWKHSPLFGDLSVGFTVFAGDGGYTERLVQHGLIGLLSFFIMLTFLWVGLPRHFGDRRIRKIHNKNLQVFVVSFLFAMLATGMFKERTIELLPVMLIVLLKLPTKYD